MDIFAKFSAFIKNSRPEANEGGLPAGSQLCARCVSVLCFSEQLHYEVSHWQILLHVEWGPWIKINGQRWKISTILKKTSIRHCLFRILIRGAWFGNTPGVETPLCNSHSKLLNEAEMIWTSRTKSLRSLRRASGVECQGLRQGGNKPRQTLPVTVLSPATPFL